VIPVLQVLVQEVPTKGSQVQYSVKSWASILHEEVQDQNIY
jgi:hypothetical protein